MRVYYYNDLRGFNNKLYNVKSNLCTYYYKDKKRFCGNYCSRKPPHGHKFNKRCWRHKVSNYTATQPRVILLMISAGERIYNRDRWIHFLNKCEEQKVPLELVIYHEDMNNCTVREHHNLISRHRPFPDIFGKVLTLKNLHGSVNFAQICNRMLDYGSKIPRASRCIVITERTIPIRSPMSVYKKAINSKCYIDISYNVGYGPVPPNLPRGPRGKPYAGANNICQGLYTVQFLKDALPTLPTYCEKFGLSLHHGIYSVTNRALFDQWRMFTGANPCEFWLVNSFILQNRSRPMESLKKHMEKTVEADKYTVAEVPQWRVDMKRTFVFKSLTTPYVIPKFDARVQRYYKGLDFNAGVSLKEIIRFIRRNKRRALFFRQVEMP